MTTIAATSSGVANRLSNEEGQAVRKTSFSTVVASVPFLLAKSCTNCSTPSERVGPANQAG
jgi:hypothetical protein